MNGRQLSERIGNIEDAYLQEAQAYLEADADTWSTKRRGMKSRSVETRGVKSRRFLLLAAVLCFMLTMTATAFAANWFGLRELILPEKQEIQMPFDPDQGGTPQINTVDMLSLAGYSDTPEYQAAVEWQNFLGVYEIDPAILETNQIFAPGTDYTYYGVYTQEMADALDVITAKYNLKLHTGMLDDLYTDQALCDQVGGDFLGDNHAGSTYMYSDGTFKFDGDITLAGYGRLDYQFMRNVRGSFTEVVLNIGDVERYTEWTYTTADGTNVTLALAENKALIIANLPDSFVTINVLAGTGTPEDDVFSAGPFMAEDLERFADSFDFSQLTPALPANPDLPRPSLEEVLNQEK